MQPNCIFCNISSKNADLLYEDYHLVAFNDIKPVAKHHVLVITKRHIKNINALKKDDVSLVEKMKQIGNYIVSLKRQEEENIQEFIMGFVKPPFNTVDHIHMHVISLPITKYWPCSMILRRFIFQNVDDIILKLKSSEK
ncbi:hypothetical protein G9A89_017867 [Geosiphon pyriformis]|nr:hypothetical protein G9A89_017867 [Geosiphon pyriformis]